MSYLYETDIKIAYSPSLDLFSFGYHVSGDELVGDFIIVDKRIM